MHGVFEICVTINGITEKHHSNIQIK